MGREFRHRWLHLLRSELPPQPCKNCCYIDLVSADRTDAVVFYLGCPGHSSWCPDGIDARRVSILLRSIYPLHARSEVWLVSSSSIEKHREQNRAVVVAADE